MKKFLDSICVGVLFTALSTMAAQAQIATFTVTTSNDGHGTPPNDVAATQTGTYASSAPVSDLVMNPLNPDPESGPNGLGVGYPFGYTVSAGTALFPTSLSGAKSQGTYLTFTITPQSGASVDLSDIDFSAAMFNSDFYNQPNQTNGNLSSGYTASLLSSADNFSADLGNISFNANTAGSKFNLGSDYSNITTPTEFRLYFYGTPDGNEADYVYLTLTDGSTINVDGAVTTPEPSTWALMLGGLGLLVYFQRRTRRA